jgi:hypothetical protein
MNVTAAPLSNDFLGRFSEVSQNRDEDTNRQSWFGSAVILDVHTERTRGTVATLGKKDR